MPAVLPPSTARLMLQTSRICSKSVVRTFASSPEHYASQRPPPTPKAYTKTAPKHAVDMIIEAVASSKPAPITDARFGPRDPERGRKAMLKVAQGGTLDAVYRPAARRVTAIIVALPLVIYLSYELYQRRFNGKEKRKPS